MLMLTPLEAGDWPDIAQQLDDSNINQAQAFAETAASRNGSRCEYRALLDDGELVAAAITRVKTVPLLRGGIAYIAAGPLTRRGQDVDGSVFASALSALADEYVTRRGLVLRILAPIASARNKEVMANAFVHAGFRETARTRTYTTMLVDLQRPLEEIRMSLRATWRNQLCHAERSGLTIDEAKGSHALEDLVGMYAEFAARKGFQVNYDASFYSSVQFTACEQERFVVRKMKHEGALVAASVHSSLGDTLLNVLSISTAESTRQRAAHLLYWIALKSAHEQGLKWYDLGGVDADANPGGYKFKAAMRGVELRAAGPYELVPPGWGGRLALAGEQAHHSLMQLKRRFRKPASI